MDRDAQLAEVDRNYDAFQRLLSSIINEHRDQFALMRDGRIVAFFDKPGEANREGVKRFPDEIFSIQEVTDEPIDLGFWSPAPRTTGQAADGACARRGPDRAIPVPIGASR